MSLTDEQQIASLTERLNALENESRRILQALHWSSKVRLVLFSTLLLFVLVSGLMFYLLYQNIKHQRIAEVQRIIREQPEQFSEPLTRQIKLLAEEQSPYVLDVFQKQVQQDSQKYIDAIDTQKAVLVTNLQKNLEGKLTESYATMLDEQEGLLIEKFPVLKDPDKLENVRVNMEKVYQKIGQRYFVEYMRDELEGIIDQLDRFPSSEPRHDHIPITEQLGSELLELVRLMLIESPAIPPAAVATKANVQSESSESNSNKLVKNDPDTSAVKVAEQTEVNSKQDSATETETSNSDDQSTEPDKKSDQSDDAAHADTTDDPVEDDN